MILYLSKHGAVRDAAERAAERSGTSAFDVKHDAAPARAALAAAAAQTEDARPRVLVLAPVYAGSIPGAMTRFLDAERERLLACPTALGLACLYEGEEGRRQIATAFPGWLVGHAQPQEVIGGRVIMRDLALPVRLLIRKIIGSSEDVRRMNWEAVDRLADWLVG